MIDMRNYFTHPDYFSIKDNFEKSFDKLKLNCDEHWSVFTTLQQKISNNKCPICEVGLTNIPNKPNTATLDHFRPKSDNMYPKLKCEPKNYILMCSLCNSTYKKDDFPLLDDSKKTTVDEKPLLFNPTEEDPLDFFELVFKQTPTGGLLELKRKSDISKDSYKYKICETMIKTFGLGYCHKYNHPHETIKKCRIGILAHHYITFIELAQAIATKNKKATALILKEKNRAKELKEYGFFRFISKNQFSIK